MTMPITLSNASHLYQDWQRLRAAQPGLRAREAAARLGVSEAELTASRLGVDAVRLRTDWAKLLPALGELGYIMALTRNEHVCTSARAITARSRSVPTAPWAWWCPPISTCVCS